MKKKPEEEKIVHSEIAPLALDFQREDLNALVGKINELILHINVLTHVD